MGMKLATKEAADRLAALKLDGDSRENLSAICSVLCKPNYGWTTGDCKRLRDVLVEWLEQYDPAKWADSYLAEQGLMRLPKDADGVPIHVGDRMDAVDDDCASESMVVTGFEACVICNYVKMTDDGRCVDEVGVRSCYAFKLRHHKTTVKDVLNEFLNEWIEADDDAEGDVFDEYAKRLREVMKDDE